MVAVSRQDHGEDLQAFGVEGGAHDGVVENKGGRTHILNNRAVMLAEGDGKFNSSFLRRGVLQLQTSPRAIRLDRASTVWRPTSAIP